MNAKTTTSQTTTRTRMHRFVFETPNSWQTIDAANLPEAVARYAASNHFPTRDLDSLIETIESRGAWLRISSEDGTML